jgi:hypothetical protein
MATSFEDIYMNFLMKITDYNYLELSEEEVEDDLYKYLKSASVNFRQCQHDLLENMDVNAKTFTVDLNYYEIEILSILMVIEYLTPHIVATENLKQLIGNREFKFYSQANLLSELTKLRRMLRLEATQLISEYTYARGLDGMN